MGDGGNGVASAVARRILAVLLLAMAAGQLSNLPEFVDIVAGYDVGGGTAAAVIAVGLVMGEALAGVGLLARNRLRRRRATEIAVGIAGAWTVLAVQAFVRGLSLENCGCFGVHLGQPLRWWVLVEDVELVALAVWVRHRTDTRLRGPVFGARGSRDGPAAS